MERADVIVLGVGGMGSATVYHLAQRGLKVCGIEQFDTGHDRGSSHGETRIIRKAYFEKPDYVPLLNRAYELWEALENAEQKKLLHKCGLVIYGPKGQSETIQGVLESARLHKIPVERWSWDEAIEHFPCYVPPENYEGVFELGAGYLLVEDCVQAHVRQAKKAGARIFENERVIDWVANPDGVKVVTERTTYIADKLVLTAGAWTNAVLQQLKLPLKLHRNAMYWYQASDDFSIHNGIGCYLVEYHGTAYYGFPKLDDRGLKVARHAPGVEITNPAELNSVEGNEERDQVERFLERVIPDVMGANKKRTHSKNCMYTMTPDEDFIIDTHPAHANVVVAAGFSGHGFKFSSVVGEIMADLVESASTHHPVTFLKLRWN